MVIPINGLLFNNSLSGKYCYPAFVEPTLDLCLSFSYLPSISFVMLGELHRDEGPLTALISKFNVSSKHEEKRRTLELDDAAFLNLLGANCQALDFHFCQNTTANYR